MHRNNKGFTLIELMIVVAIVGILAAVFIPVFDGAEGRKSDPSNSKYMLESVYEYTNIEFPSVQTDVCSSDDSFETPFEAKNRDGNPVKGVVCNGKKGMYVRFPN